MYDTIQPMRPLTAADIQRNLLTAMILRGTGDDTASGDDTATEDAA